MAAHKTVQTVQTVQIVKTNTSRDIPKDREKKIQEMFELEQVPNSFYEQVLEMLKKPAPEQNTSWRDIHKRNCQTIEALKEELFKFKNAKFMRKIASLPDKIFLTYFDPIEMERSNSNNYTFWITFVIFGCYTSTDIDVAVVCPDLIDKKTNYVRKLYTTEINRLYDQLRALGYDITRKIDYSLVYIEDSRIMGTKGGSETTNIIFNTWYNHIQVMASLEPLAFALYPIKEIELNDDDYNDKLRAFAMYVWRNLGTVIVNGHDSDLHNIKKILYSPQTPYITIEKLKEVDLINDDDLDYKYRSCMKSMTMKLVQIIYFYHTHKTSYIKPELAKIARQFPTLIKTSLTPDQLELSCKYNLTRGKSGQYHAELLPNLLEEYFDIAHKCIDFTPKPCFAVKKDQLLSSETSVTPSILEKFLESPIEPTPEFERDWARSGHGSDSRLNSIFTQTLDFAAFERLKLQVNLETAECMTNQIIMVPQRSDEWLKMLKFYTCGKNGAELDETSINYQLIRGSILEELCCSHCPIFADLEKLNTTIKEQFPGFTILQGELIPLEVGMVVEEIDMPKCRAAAPDLLLACENIMIPVEIKGLKSSTKNADYRRELELAKKQISSIKEIMGGFVIEFGIVVMCWIEELTLKMEVLVIKFD